MILRTNEKHRYGRKVIFPVIGKITISDKGEFTVEKRADALKIIEAVKDLEIVDKSQPLGTQDGIEITKEAKTESLDEMKQSDLLSKKRDELLAMLEGYPKEETKDLTKKQDIVDYLLSK